jgi:hypothetical protein
MARRLLDDAAMNAWLCSLSFLVACGDSSMAPSPDAPPVTPASVSVYTAYPLVANTDGVMPRAGATVVVHDAAGNLIDRQVTDESGIAVTQPGASVTVAPPPGLPGPFYTWVDVAPGDHLYTSQPWGGPMPGMHQVTVTIPRDGDDVTSYIVSGAGFGGHLDTIPASGDLTLTATVSDDAPPTEDLVVEADHSDGHKRFLVIRDAATTGAVDASTRAWADPAPIDLTLEGFHDDTRALLVVYSLRASGKPLWVADHVQNAANGTLAAHLDSPGALGDGTALQLVYQRLNAQRRALCAFTMNGATPTVDLAALSPPAATNVTITGGRAFAWTADGDPARAAATMLDFRSADAGDSSWSVMLPPDRRSFELPAMPADLPAFPPAVSARVVFIGGNDPAGYAAVRTDPQAFDPNDWAQVVPATAGTYCMVELGL